MAKTKADKKASKQKSTTAENNAPHGAEPAENSHMAYYAIDPAHLAKPWAIAPRAMDVMVSMLTRDAESADAAAIALREGGPWDAEKYEVVANGVAVIPVVGVLTKQNIGLTWDFWSFREYSGIRANIDAALSDPSVKSILLMIDSPGGMVGGAKELADYIYSVREQKPFYAYADSLMASAAYWIGTAAGYIAAPATAEVGSIGVRTTHVDFSQMDQRMGIKITHLTAGTYKAMGNDAEPLSQEAADYIQGTLDTLYSLFVDGVARNRNVTTDAALAMADGKVFLADEALGLNMIDEVVPDVAEFIMSISSNSTTNISNSGGKKMDINTLKSDYADVYEAVYNEGMSDGMEQAHADSTAASNVVDMVDAMFGAEYAGKLKKAIDAGLTADSMKVAREVFGGGQLPDDEDVKTGDGNTDGGRDDNAGKNADKAQILAELAGLHGKGVRPAGATSGNSHEAAGDDFDALVDDYRAKHNCGRAKAIKAVANANPEAHQAWLDKRRGKDRAS